MEYASDKLEFVANIIDTPFTLNNLHKAYLLDIISLLESGILLQKICQKYYNDYNE